MNFRNAAGAWRRQKKEKREALQNYQSLFEQKEKRSTDGSCSEGRSRRRREWCARKRMLKHPNIHFDEEPVKREFDRKKEADLALIKEREEQRRARIEELSSEKVCVPVYNANAAILYTTSVVSACCHPGLLCVWRP